MKNIIISALLLIALASCGDDANPTSPKVEKHTIRGKVINYITDLPVDGVYVSTNPLSRTTQTDANGKFVLEDIEDGEYEIILLKYGYSELRSSIKINSNNTVNELTFPLKPDSVSNEKPLKPELISPLNNATISTTSLMFRWYSEDIDNKNVSFSIFFGSNPEELTAIATNLKKSSYSYDYVFQKNTTYYWKVVASNLYQKTSSEIYEFQYDLNNQPDKPKLLKPTFGEIVYTNNIQFGWSGYDSDGDELLYDLYFGINKNKLLLLESDITSNTYSINYNFNETDKYYWRIEAKDKSQSISSDTYEFTYKDTSTFDVKALVGYWKLDGNASDEGPNNYNGIEDGVTYVNDRDNNSNSSASFNGTNKSNPSKILLSKNIRLSNNFTIALWVKQDPSLGVNDGVGNFDCFSQWGESALGGASYNLGIDKNKYVYLFTYSATGAIKHEIFDDKIETGKWYHIAISFSNGTVKYYLNGNMNSKVSGFPEPQASNLNPSIGGRQDQLSSFHGAIDNVIVYSRVLTDQEIKELAK